MTHPVHAVSQAASDRARALRADPIPSEPAKPTDDPAVLRQRIAELELQNAELTFQNAEITDQLAEIAERLAAKSSEQDLLQQVADNIREVFWITTADKTKVLYVSAAFEDMYKQPISALYADPLAFVRWIHPDDLPRVLVARERQRFGNWDLDYRIVWPDGQVRYLYARSVPLKDANGQVYRICGISEDVTNRVLAEQSRTASQRLLASVATNAPILLLSFDRAARVTFADGNVLSQLGLSVDDFISSTVPDSEKQHRFGRLAQEVDALLDTQSQIAESVMQALAGIELDSSMQLGQQMFETRFTPVRNDQGEVDSVIMVCLDVTRRHQAEQLLLAEQAHLQEMLEAHERDRRLITYEIHDSLVQQVTGAKMHLEAFAAQCQDLQPHSQKQVAYLQKLMRAALADGRRLISGLRPPILDDQGIVAALHYLVEEKRVDGCCPIEFVTDVNFSRLMPLMEGIVYRIVQEALNNMQRHAESPRARVELRQEQDRLLIEIRDWGRGFDPVKVTEKSYGLAGIRERARLLQGKAEIDSTPGSGTRVRVVLPIVLESAAAPQNGTL